MNRGKKAFYNSMASVLVQVVTLVCDLILPRLILSHFGSSYNGITSSISQFLSVIALLKAGVGGATRASLYKSLASKDTNQISATIKATEKFMRRVALIFGGFIIIFACIYPYFIRNEFDWLFTSTLVLIISISTFIQYFFGITYQMLLQADQKMYVYSILSALTIIINTIISVILINLGFGIHVVKLGSAAAFSITPLFLNIYAKRHYKLKRNVEPDYSSIGQRWDAFFHQIAGFIHSNTDITLLTIFSNTKEISVYSIYYMVGNGVKKVLFTVSSGVEAAFGSIIANGEKELLKKDLRIYENLIHIISSILFGATLVLITPFVTVYTRGVTDVNYERYIFGYLVVFAETLYCLRIPYEAIINAAGHYKQTKKYAFIEAFINIIISVIMVNKFGLVGVVVGTLCAISFRTIVYATYGSRNIVHRSPAIFLKRFLITALTMLLIFLTSKFVPPMLNLNYISWAIYAIIITLISTVLTALMNFIFYREDVLELILKLFSILKQFIKKKKA